MRGSANVSNWAKADVPSGVSACSNRGIGSALAGAIVCPERIGPPPCRCPRLGAADDHPLVKRWARKAPLKLHVTKHNTATAVSPAANATFFFTIPPPQTEAVVYHANNTRQPKPSPTDCPLVGVSGHSPRSSRERPEMVESGHRGVALEQLLSPHRLAGIADTPSVRCRSPITRKSELCESWWRNCHDRVPPIRQLPLIMNTTSAHGRFISLRPHGEGYRKFVDQLIGHANAVGRAASYRDASTSKYCRCLS